MCVQRNQRHKLPLRTQRKRHCEIPKNLIDLKKTEISGNGEY